MLTPRPFRSIWLCLGLAFVTAGLAAQDEVPTQIVTYREVDGHALKMHVFLPEDFELKERRPAVVFFFGGGWNGGSP